MFTGKHEKKKKKLLLCEVWIVFPRAVPKRTKQMDKEKKSPSTFRRTVHNPRVWKHRMIATPSLANGRSSTLGLVLCFFLSFFTDQFDSRSLSLSLSLDVFVIAICN